MENDSRTTELSASYGYLYKLKYLDLHNNSIVKVTENFWNNLLHNRNLTWLNLANNRINALPRKVEQLVLLEKIWLEGNPFHCDCSMTWMISWLNNFTTYSGEHIIQDYQKLTCHSGKAKGLPISTLNRVILGCYPKELTTWQKITIGVGSGVGLILIVFLLVKFIQILRDFRFFLFHKLKIHSVLKINNDNEETIEDKKYDAYLSYR